MARQGRPAKGISYQGVEEVTAWANANMREHQGLPSNPEHREIVIGALMMRLKDVDSNLFLHCYRAIGTIANLETCRFASKDRIEEEIAREAYNIVHGKVRRLTHAPFTLQQQRGALIDYISK
ncbi:MAG: hypothetical protein L0H94_06825 [Nitrospira sp.]|nr:hypothetical protein [Nitrospira sp.]